MDALLSDINQAGIGRGLQFELFRPGTVELKDYYAELPDCAACQRALSRHRDRVRGGSANLSRIVTLHNLACRARPRTAPAAGADGGHRSNPLPGCGRSGWGAKAARCQQRGQEMSPLASQGIAGGLACLWC